MGGDGAAHGRVLNSIRRRLPDYPYEGPGRTLKLGKSFTKEEFEKELGGSRNVAVYSERDNDWYTGRIAEKDYSEYSFFVESKDLAPGWKLATDKTSGKPCYLHEPTGKAQWRRPALHIPMGFSFAKGYAKNSQSKEWYCRKIV